MVPKATSAEAAKANGADIAGDVLGEAHDAHREAIAAPLGTELRWGAGKKIFCLKYAP